MILINIIHKILLNIPEPANTTAPKYTESITKKFYEKVTANRRPQIITKHPRRTPPTNPTHTTHPKMKDPRPKENLYNIFKVRKQEHRQRSEAEKKVYIYILMKT